MKTPLKQRRDMLRRVFHLSRNIPHAAFVVVLVALSTATLQASEADAIAISENIRQLHMPYGTVLDPVFASSDPASREYSRLAGYSRAGDSAVWTGHYLAAEAFRYAVTRSPAALDNVWQALRGIHSLLEITGSDLLARCLIPADSPYAAAIQQAGAGHGIHYGTLRGSKYFWIGDTSRDQYSGVMFGLSAAYDLVPDASIRDFIRKDVTRILNYLLRFGWNVVMPRGGTGTIETAGIDYILAYWMGRSFGLQ